MRPETLAGGGIKPEGHHGTHRKTRTETARHDGLADRCRRREREVPDRELELPTLLTADDAAQLLRTTRRAIYAMVERNQLPAPVRVGRRLLLRQDDLARWLETKQQGIVG